QLADARGEVKVQPGDAAGLMCRQKQDHVAVADIDIWVVTRVFGQPGHLVDERDGIHETLPPEAAMQSTFLPAPAPQVPQCQINISGTEWLGSRIISGKISVFGVHDFLSLNMN